MPATDYDGVLVDIIRYVYHTEVSSDRALQRARIALLDSLGCAIETLAQSSEARAFIGPTVPGTTVPSGFRLPGTSFILDPIKGAFDLGSLIRYLDHNDAYPGAEWGHPSDNLGAIIAVADWLSRRYAAGTTSGTNDGTTDVTTDIQSSGGSNSMIITLKDVLIAQIKAYEIQGILQMKNAFNKCGLDHTILVKIASTAVVAHLMGLTEEQALSALSHAWLDGHPLRSFRQAPNTGPRKGWAAGDACNRAVHLCFLAKAGQPGAPSVLTAPKWGFQDALFGGQELMVPKSYGTFVEYHFFKLVMAEAHAISAAKCAVELAARLKALKRDVGEIEKMVIRTQEAGKIIIDKSGPLMNPADRDHCMQYIVAVSLLKGSFIVGEDYADDSPWASDQRVDELREKMLVVEDEQFTRDYHDPWKVRSCANAISVVLRSGEVIPEILVKFPIGHPMHSATLDLVKEKFKVNMRKGDYEEAIVEEVKSMVEDDDVPVHNFIDLFVKQDEIA
ncbi:MmgE/PrpD family-domain-containing protein [Xylariaceae sp. FL0016]|nr:MmgE/PrpD family-domain-containing protein [Xylariaceae sp. FL0016]